MSSSKDDQSSAPTATLGSAAALSMVSSVAVAGSALLRAKIVALFLGPIGLGRYAEISQLITLFNAPAAMFAGPGLVARLSEEKTRQDLGSARHTRDAAFTALLLSSSLAGALAVVASYFLLPAETEPGHPNAGLTAIAAIGAAMSTWAAVVGPVLIAFGQLRLLAILSILQAVLVAGLTSIGVVVGGLTGQFVGAAIAPFVCFPLFLRLMRAGVPALGGMPTVRFDRAFLHSSLRLGGTFLIGSLGIQGSLSIVRWTLLQWGGTASNGLFQASWAVGTVSTSVLVATMSSYAFPRFTSAPDAESLSREIDDVARFVLRLGTPIVLVTLAFRGVLLETLYSPDFVAAADILRYQLLGDLPKLLSWVYAGPLLYRGKVRAFLLTESSAALLLVGGMAGLIPVVGIHGTGIGCAVAYTLQTVVTAVVVVRTCKVKLNRSRHLWVLGWSAFGYLLSVFEGFLPEVRWAILAAAILWMWRTGGMSPILKRLRRGRHDEPVS